MYRKLEEETAGVTTTDGAGTEECPCPCSGEEGDDQEPGAKVDKLGEKLLVDLDLNS